MPMSCERVFKFPKSTEVWTNMVASSSEYVPKNPNGLCYWSQIAAVAIQFGTLTICLYHY